MAEIDPILLDKLSRAVTEDGGFGEVLQSIMGTFGCASATLVSVDPLAPESSLTLTAGLLPEHVKLYHEFANIDPAPIIFSRMPVGTASATDRIFTPDELRENVFFQEFMRPIHLAETMCGNLFADGERFALIGLQRGGDRRAFDDEEIAAVGQLVPHIARALKLRRIFENTAAMTHAAQAAIDRLPAGVMLLDRAGTALFVNASMRAIARRGDGFALDRKGRPFPIDLTARRDLERLLAEAGSQSSVGGIFTVPRADLGGRYTGIVAPVPAAFNDVVWQRRGRAEILLIVHDPDSRSRDAAEILQRALNLTRAAARLVAALAADDDLQSFADREGITIHTARFHLRTALARTGTGTQAELVRVAVRLLRDVAMRG